MGWVKLNTDGSRDKYDNTNCGGIIEGAKESDFKVSLNMLTWVVFTKLSFEVFWKA